MPFQKVYECICDYCGEVCYHIYDKSSESITTLREAGIVVSNRHDKVYCDKKCYKMAQKGRQ